MEFTDQIGNTLELSQQPKRIISLVPSQTELLYDLGLDEEVIGITKFCIHPGEWFRTKTRVGGTKTVDIEKIRSLQPDFIIANKEENVKEQIEALQKIAPVWVSDINNLEDALEMMKSIGEMVGKDIEVNKLIELIRERFDHLNQPITQSTNYYAAYLIWKDPYMTIGGDTFINDMLQRAGFSNVFSNLHRYPEINIDDLATSNCEVILLSSEPYPFKQKHIEELKSQIGNSKYQILKFILVDGEMFSWYGSRSQNAPGYFLKLREEISQLQTQNPEL
jgi:ABC-type Fe3+-hydroxamate transport system substrate-binding protein